jgi:hypothetical protein
VVTDMDTGTTAEKDVADLHVTACCSVVQRTRTQRVPNSGLRSEPEKRFCSGRMGRVAGLGVRG